MIATEGSNLAPPNTVEIMGMRHTVMAGNCGSSLSLVSSDDDEEEITSIASHTNEAAIPERSTISVVNSSDVVVGSVTQFHGPVTIVQHAHPVHSTPPQINGNIPPKLVTTDCPTIENVHIRTCKPKNIFIYLSGMSLIIVIVALSVIFSLNSKFENNAEVTQETTAYDNTTNSSATQDVEELFKPLGKYKLISRSAWAERPPTRIVPMTLPIEYIIVSHTAQTPCKYFGVCAVQLRNMQNDHVATIGTSDIGYNFIIGGDANVYVARGWDRQNFHQDRSIGVCFSGNYVHDRLSEGMKDSFRALIKLGSETGKLPRDYKIIAHNQTYPTLSPGPNVYKFIKTLPNFDPTPIH